MGCNYISRHRQVDHVCAFDRQVRDDITTQPRVGYWTRRGFGDAVWQVAQTPHRVYDSGLLAISIARHLGCHRIYLLGFDWGISNRSQYDDLYTWRVGHPNKTSPDKWASFREMARVSELWVVHQHHGRDIAPAQWLVPGDFVERCHDEHD